MKTTSISKSIERRELQSKHKHNSNIEASHRTIKAMDTQLTVSREKTNSVKPVRKLLNYSSMFKIEKHSRTLLSFLIIGQISVTSSLGSHTNTMISLLANTSELYVLQENSTEYSTADTLAIKSDSPVVLPGAISLNTLETFTTNEPDMIEDTNTGRSFTTMLNEETSTGANEELNDTATENHIELSDLSGNSLDTFKYQLIEETADSEANEIFPKKASYSMKTRRQAENYRDPVDWWVNLTAKPATKGTKSSKSGGSKRKPDKTQKKHPAGTKEPPPKEKVSPKVIVYKEQPLNQNIIITIKYQLSAIKRQHKTLVTRSMRQLQQLDNRLIESYRLCLKRKLPLYAGMLYRTRDFVTKMAKEVKVERNVLEAMTKQVQNVLRQKMTNRTLVREYNKLMAASTELPITTRQSKTNSFDETQTQQTNQQQQTVKLSTNKVIASSKAKKENTFVIHENQLLNTTGCKHDGQESNFLAAKKKQTRYTVSVNEVNLKKELNKIQALIDRINGSCYELNLVTDDINFLFKLTPEAGRKGSFQGNQKSTKSHQNENPIYMLMDQKRGKMFKSPSRILFEKYGKLSMFNEDPTTTNPTRGFQVENTTNLPEMKPLFDSSSFVYKDFTEMDLTVD